MFAPSLQWVPAAPVPHLLRYYGLISPLLARPGGLRSPLTTRLPLVTAETRRSPSGRALARAAVGPRVSGVHSFDAWSGFLIRPWPTFPAALPEIPYGGFSPVRLQAPGTTKFSVEPSCSAQFAPAFEYASANGIPASEYGTGTLANSPGPWGPRSDRVLLSRPSSLNRPHPPV